MDHVYLFREIPDGYLAIKTPFLDLFDAGCFDIQKRRWLLQWIEVAKTDPSPARVRRFRIDPQSFHEFATDEELLANVDRIRPDSLSDRDRGIE